MSEKRYRITVENLSREKGNGAPQSLGFDVSSHDDLFAIVERMRQRGDIPHDQVPALAIGLKLFTGVMLANRGIPLFEALEPHIRDFMKQLKKAPGKP